MNLPAKPIWWKAILGFVLALSQVLNLVNRAAPSPTTNRDRWEGMHAMEAILIFVGLWLLWSGTKPLRPGK